MKLCRSRAVDPLCLNTGKRESVFFLLILHFIVLRLGPHMDPQAFDIHTFLQLKDMMNEIATLFHSLRDDKKVRAVILTGSGDKAFSAGVDLLKADARSLNHKNGGIGLGISNRKSPGWKRFSSTMISQIGGWTVSDHHVLNVSQ